MLIDSQKQQQKHEKEDDRQEENPEDPERGELLGQEKRNVSAAPQEEQTGKVSGHPVAPDGGWGWVVAAAVAFSCVAMILPILSFSFVFADYLEQIGEGAQGMTTIMSVMSCVSSFIGILCNALFQRFSFRQISMMGGLIHAVGQGSIAFATSLVHFILSAVLIGIGAGLIAPAIFTAINSYFDRRRTFAMGLVQFVIGLGGVGVPIMTQKLVADLGFRSTQYIICAITVLIIPAALPLKPIKHEVNDGSAENSLKSHVQNDSGEERKSIVAEESAVDYVDDKSTRENSAREEDRNGSVNQDVKMKNEEETSREDDKRDLLHNNNVKKQRRSSSIAEPARRPRISITSLSSIPYPELVLRKPENQSKRWWSTIIDLFDLRLMQDLRLVNVLVGTSLTFFVDMMFTMMLPLYLFHNNLSHEDSAFCMSLVGVADLVARLSFLIIGACFAPSNRIIFLISAAVSVLLRAMYIFIADYTSVMVVSALLGFSKCFIMCVFTLVLGEACSVDRFPAALGIQSVFVGLLNVTFGALLGKLKDMTGSFSSSIWLLTGLGLLCVIPWTLELAVTAIRRRNKLRDT